MLILLQFIGLSAILMLLFALFLAREKTFRLNRWVLLGLVPAAMIIPFLSFPVYLPQESISPIDFLPALAQSQSSLVTTQVASSQPNWLLNGFFLVYFPVFIFLLYKKLNALYKLINWTKAPPVREIQGAFLILSENVRSPFSFGKYIFMHPSDYTEGNENTEIILKHELVHITQKHHIDLAVLEFLSVICWFNPVVFLVKKAMVLNHEYLADQEMQHFTHPSKYKKLLLKLTISNDLSIWTSSFSPSSLKRRLVMMNKPLKKSSMRLSIFSFGLFTTLIILGFGFKINAQQSVPSFISSFTPGPLQGEHFTQVEQQPEFKGGMAAFYSYVEGELKYPKEARQKGIEGQVHIQFVVEEDGSLSNVSAKSGIGSGCEEEAVRVVKNSPAFLPGKQRDKPIRVRMVLPIIFSLNPASRDYDKLPKGNISVEEADPRSAELKVEASYTNGRWEGYVLNQEGNVLPGANIVVMETNTGTVTDVNGHFIIETDRFQRLVISFVGYKNVELEVK